MVSQPFILLFLTICLLENTSIALPDIPDAGVCCLIEKVKIVVVYCMSLRGTKET